jgi:hypothetical protein
MHNYLKKYKLLKQKRNVRPTHIYKFGTIPFVQLLNLDYLVRRLRIQASCLTLSDRAALLTKFAVHLHTVQCIYTMEAPNVLGLGPN